jgi:glycosyltransferase involved in cell wall biosynthesis
MKLVFFCNFLNHHQVLVADELYRLLDNDYRFVATMPVDESLLKGGSDYSNTKSYCICAYNGGKALEQALTLAREAEVCVFGGDALSFAIERGRNGKGLSFEISERWLKKGWLNLASPRLMKWLWSYHTLFHKAGFYRLCASAFTSEDDMRLRAYKGRAFEWGYFTDVKDFGFENGKDVIRMVTNGSILNQTKPNKTNLKKSSLTKLMWCARFIDFKHPEMAVKLAKRLKVDGYNFQLDMYGDGKMRSVIQKMVNGYGLADYICLKKNVPNKQIQEAMANHDIFLFTSSKKEGWGVVANEAMSNKCCLVGSDEIGAVPYLVKDGVNGMVFKSKSVDSLYQQVKYLLDHPAERRMMAEQGYQDMVSLWNSKHAAESLLTLIKDIQNGQLSSIQEGPCSKA